jgi:hypothetical protein
MNKVTPIIFATLFFMGTTLSALAQYEQGSPKGSPMGEWNGFPGQSKLAIEDVQATIEEYIEVSSNEAGTFPLFDPRTGAPLKLKFIEFHNSIKKQNEVHTLCVDFQDADTGEIIDVDFNVIESGDALSVSGVRFHKIVKDKGSSMEAPAKGSPMGGSPKGSY